MGQETLEEKFKRFLDNIGREDAKIAKAEKKKVEIPPPRPTEVTDETFERLVLKSRKPVLVDFWAPWCGPCKQLTPMINTLTEEHTKSLKVFKMNVDANKTTPAVYGIRGIPNLILFKKGEIIEQMTGLPSSKARLYEMLERAGITPDGTN